MTYHVTPGRYKPPDFSDAGNAEVFCFYHQHDLIYTDALGWLWWNGMVWERGDHKALALAKELAGKMLAESERELKEALADLAQAKLNKVMDKATSSTEASDTKRNVSEATEYANHAKATRNALRLKNMLELSKPDLIVPLDQLDADRSIMNTTAGIVDLTTGKIRPHDPAAYCTMITTCGPGDQGRELWEAHLSEVTEDDGSKEGFLQMSTGADAYGKVYNEGIKIAVGGGKNGKSTTFNAIQYVLGDYAGSIDVKVLTTDKTNQGASLATLRGNPSNINTWLRSFCKRHGLRVVHCHQFRHTAASLLIGSGLDLASVAQRLGHSKLSTTANIYTHATSDADAKVTAALERIIYTSKENTQQK